MSDIENWLADHAEWSEKTFGSGTRTEGILKHIMLEIEEVRSDPHDVTEWLDIVVLALDGYWRHGGNPFDVMALLQSKLERNKSRKYPKVPDDKPSLHYKE